MTYINLRAMIVEHRLQAKLEKNQSIAKKAQVQILEEKGIYEDGKIIVIHIRLMLKLPVPDALKSVRVVPHYLILQPSINITCSRFIATRIQWT